MTIATEGFRAASTHDERVYEAAKLFVEGSNSSNFAKQQTLLEAFTTDDFPILLGAAFEKEAIASQKNAVKEYEAFTYTTKVPDFRPKKLVDLFGNEYFEDVEPGEEYKGGDLDEAHFEVRVGKTGKNYGLTWETMLSRDFSDLADFPKLLGNAAVNTENRKVYELLADANGLREEFFGTVATPALTDVNLQAAIESLAVKTNHRDELVDISQLVLVVPPALQFKAQQILNAIETETVTTNGNRTIKTRGANPFKGLVTLQVSREFARQNKAASAGTSWALLPARSTDNPAVALAQLTGHEQVDIRVKRDQGQRVGGGDVSVSEGSFNDDTIWFRGRHVIGASQGFIEAVYASNGTTAS